MSRIASECDTGNLPSGGRGAGDIHGNPHRGDETQRHPHIHLSTTAGGVTSAHTGKTSFYARKVMRMWRYRITRLLSRKYPELVIPDKLAVEGTANGTGIASGHALPPRLEYQHIRGDG